MNTRKLYRPVTGSITAKPLQISNSTQRLSPKLKIVGCFDQYHQKWLAVYSNGQWAFAPRDVLSFDERLFYSKLSLQSVFIKTSPKRRQIETIAENGPFDKSVYVVNRLGWHGRIYVWPGRELPKTTNGRWVVNDLHNIQVRWGTAGSLDSWREGLSRLNISRHTLPTFALAASCASIVQRVFHRSENSQFEFVDQSSVGKSTLLRLAAMVFGNPEQFVRTWDTTVMGVENMMAQSNDGLLLLDELGHFCVLGRIDRVNSLRSF